MGLIVHSETKFYSELVPQSKFEWLAALDSQGWDLWIKITINAKDEVKTLFEVLPPIWMPRKEADKLKFKTNSYKELKKWLKKHKNELKDPIQL